MSRAAPTRRIEVDPERVTRWVSGFAERHGVLAWPSARRSSDGSAGGGSAGRGQSGGGSAGASSRVEKSATVSSGAVCAGFVGSVDVKSVALSATDGATAILEPFLPADPSQPSGPGDLEELAAWVMPPLRLALILVRRGGYGVGVGQGPELIAHKVGTRYVQSRTAAGGWSQQRFARRRANQADALVGSVIEHTLRVVLGARTDAIVVGGDRTLSREVLADPRLARLAQLPRRELFDLPDPRLVVLKQALRRARAVRITLSEPDALVVDTDEVVE